MQKLPPPNPPPYTVGSVDRALRLLHMLRDRGEVRIKPAAKELGVAESTVHRLMAMLVFHGFALQDETRAYVPGYSLGAVPLKTDSTKTLRDVAASHMEALSREIHETVNLQVRSGTKLRFLWCCEGDRVLRIISRIGAVMPAAKSAGGRVLLAGLPDETVVRLYHGPVAQAQGNAMTTGELQGFLGELREHRRNGFATTNGETEVGVAAIAMPIRGDDGRPIAALTISMPTVRYDECFDRNLIVALCESRDAIEQDLRVHALA
jgi:IclR family acetate operon transcriptional repressor